jgi:benzylsuccinate CoA-transferase BbsF subunit
MIGRELAEHGATVVRVESHQRPCILRVGGPFKDGKPGVNRTGAFATYNTQKYGITLDLNHPKSKQVTRRLVTWADVVSDSMTPGSMAKWNLDYEECRKINPGIVYFSTTQQGQSGPHRSFRGFGYHSNALLGICGSTGWPDADPTLAFSAWTDFVAPWYVTMAVALALLRRRKTGEGMYIEQSQFEAGLSCMGPHLLDYRVNGNVVTRGGNRDRYMSPHGVYPCQGTDRWVAIAIANDEQWQAFCKAMDHPVWTRDARFATVLKRKENEDELDRLIGEWTQSSTAEKVMAIMQDAGVPAGVVETAEDLMNDPQLEHRQHFRVLDHPEIGPHSYHSPAYRLSKTPCAMTRPAPCLGEHNAYVYQEILDFSEDEIADMIAEGVITTEEPVPT